MEYIFTDLIRFRNKKGLLFEGSIVQEYLTQLDKDFPLNFVDFHLLQKIVDTRAEPQEDNCINIHMRLGDIIHWKQYGSGYDVMAIIKKYGLHRKYKKCKLFLGLWAKQGEKESYEVLEKVMLDLRTLGIESNIEFNSVDDDFIHLATCKCLIPSIRGFSWLAASMNPNQVYWDIQTPPRFRWLVDQKLRPTLVKGYEYHLTQRAKLIDSQESKNE